VKHHLASSRHAFSKLPLLLTMQQVLVMGLGALTSVNGQ